MRETVTQWLGPHNATALENETRVIAACDCTPGNGGYEMCRGWVLTWRDEIQPHHTVLTDPQRAEVGLVVPDPWAHLNEFL